LSEALTPERRVYDDKQDDATLEWVDWFNNRRLLEPIGNIRLPKPRSDTTPGWTTSRWQRNLIQSASDNPGAVQTDKTLTNSSYYGTLTTTDHNDWHS
jgi:hypothetical protein